MLQSAERPTAVTAVEVVPVAGMLAFSMMTQEPFLRGGVALDVGEPPLVACRRPFGNKPGTQASRVAQARHDRVEVERTRARVARRRSGQSRITSPHSARVIAV